MARGAMAATAEELEDVLCLDFSDVGEPDRDVTPSNRSEFVRKLIYHTLIGQRKVSCRGVCSLSVLSRGTLNHAVPSWFTSQGALVAMKKGFDALAIAAHLRLFSCVELMGLVCGQQSFTAAELVSVLVFEQFPTNSPTPGKFAQ